MDELLTVVLLDLYAHHGTCCLVKHKGLDLAARAHLGAVVDGLLHKKLQWDVVDVDAVGLRLHAVPLEQTRAGRRGVARHPLGACMVDHPVDALGALNCHGTHEFGVARHLLAAEHELDDVVHVVGIARVGPLRLFSQTMSAEVGEHAGALRVATSRNAALDHEHVVAGLSQTNGGVHACGT